MFQCIDMKSAFRNHKKLSIAVLTITSILLAIFIYLRVIPHVMFEAMQMDEDFISQSRKTWIAKKLSHFDYGIDLAVSDVSIFGGLTKGMYRVTLNEAKDRQNIISRLKVSMNDEKLSIPNRVAACKILYEYTFDEKYMKKIDVLRSSDWGRNKPILDHHLEEAWYHGTQYWK